jgi:cytochrome P450
VTATLPPFPMPRAHPLDPPPGYRDLRASAPIARVATERGPVWVVSRHEEARAVLTDRRFSSDPRTPGYPSYLTGDVPPPPGFFMQLDPPDHPRLRRTVSREFLVNHIDSLRPRMVAILDGLIDAMLDREPPVDLVRALAYPMASTVICELLGVPYSDHVFFQEKVDAVLSRTAPPEQTQAAAIELMGYFDQLVTAREQDPGDDVLGRLVRERTDRGDGRISHAELVGIAALLLLGGYDTMAQMIGLGTATLLAHPEQRQALVADPQLVPGAVEELLRYLTVNHSGLPRAAIADVQIGDVRIAAGDGVLVLLNSANRDAGVFDRPDELDVHRGGRDHLAFGHGFHKCVGATMARAELTVVFGTLFRRVPTLALVTPVEQLPYRHDMVLYGLYELPVTW